MIDGLSLSPREAAIVLARVLVRRALGDVPGHPFHGNQWTDADVDLSDPDFLLHLKATNYLKGVYYSTKSHMETIQQKISRPTKLVRGGVRGKGFYHIEDDAGRKFGPQGWRTLGGAGSGNFGHEGRPGEVGGSGEGGGSVTHESVKAVSERIIKESGGRLTILDLRLKPSGDVDIETIAVAPHEEGQGVGTKAMESLTQWADERGVRLILSPSQKGYQPVEEGPKTTSTSRLKTFYKEFGFVEPRGRHYDPTLSSPTKPVMFRDPRKPRTLLSNSENTPVHEAADAHYDEVYAITMYAFAWAKRSVDQEALTTAMALKDKKTAEKIMAPVPALVALALAKLLPDTLYRTLVHGGQAGFSMLREMRLAEMRTAASVRETFTMTSIDAIEWAKEYVGDLIKQITQTTKDNIRDAIIKGLSGEVGRREVIADIMDAIGDAARASLIAHTETMRAANEGLAQSWDQAIEKGYLTNDNKKRWIAAGDGPPPYGATCEICLGLDGETVKLSEEFSIGADPPAHPSCRCTMGIVG